MKTITKQYSDLCKTCNGTGQLAHISAKGIGGKIEDERDKPYNWLHLCQACHIGVQHQKGFSELLKIAPHLKNKIKKAQKGVDNASTIIEG